jgi:hypothetical protein
MTYTEVWDVMQGRVSDSMIQRDVDQAFIPFDEANTDYVEYLAWLDEGNEPTPYAPPAQAKTDPSLTTTRTVTRTTQR